MASDNDLPADVYPESRNRLPLPERAALDDDGQRLYDIATSGTLIAGLQGPTGLRLYAPKLGLLKRNVNDYLRFEAGLDPALCELTILIAARETDQHFEWNAHEDVALKFGLSPATIDVVRSRLPLEGLAEAEAALIRLGREALQQRTVAPATFADAVRLFGAVRLQGYVSLMAEYVATAAFLTVFDQQLPPARRSTLP
jgi:4-carboxymuconolactone decarboxylase